MRKAKRRYYNRFHVEQFFYTHYWADAVSVYSERRPYLQFYHNRYPGRLA